MKWTITIETVRELPSDKVLNQYLAYLLENGWKADVIRQLQKTGECSMSSNELGTNSKTTIRMKTLS
jgi:hypothetical protein